MQKDQSGGGRLANEFRLELLAVDLHAVLTAAVTVPAGVKARIDTSLSSAGISSGRIFRPVNKRGVIVGTEIRDEKAVWRLVMRYAKATDLGKLAPHDLRRTCAKLCRKAGGELEQIQLLLGHASIQTTERYLGCKQKLRFAVNDRIGIEPDNPPASQ